MITEYSKVTDLGSKKKVNQDASYVGRVESRLFNSVMGLICDGVGSCEFSEIASGFAVDAFSDWFTKCYPQFADIADEDEFCSVLYERWFALFETVNSYVMSFAKIGDIRLGSTFTCLLIRDRFYYVLHIGDTRVYSIDNDIEQLTTDHTVTQREIEKGELTYAEAREDNRRHTLTKCLGMKEHIRPDFYTGQIDGNKKFLICSDGFRDKLTDEEIADMMSRDKVLKKDRLTRSMKKIIKIGRTAGETDNVTAVLIQASEDR